MMSKPPGQSPKNRRNGGSKTKTKFAASRNPSAYLHTEHLVKDVVRSAELPLLLREAADILIAVNPFHQMPSMQDGDFCLAEQNSMYRYIAAKYAPELYGGTDPHRKGTIDWALDYTGGAYQDTNLFWYATIGFKKLPEAEEDVKIMVVLRDWRVLLGPRRDWSHDGRIDCRALYTILIFARPGSRVARCEFEESTRI